LFSCFDAALAFVALAVGLAAVSAARAGAQAMRQAAARVPSLRVCFRGGLIE
jgi:hypothetical protein